MQSVVDSAVVDSIEQAFQEVEDLLLPVDIENGEELRQGSRPAVLLFSCMFRYFLSMLRAVNLKKYGNTNHLLRMHHPSIREECTRLSWKILDNQERQ